MMNDDREYKNDSDSSKKRAADLFPVAIEEKKILHQRALRYANMNEVDQSARMRIRYITFKCGSEQKYALMVDQVDAVMSVYDLKRPPSMPAEVCGLINWHGLIVAVVDLKNIFHIQTVKDIERYYVVVARLNDELIALMVDDIGSIETCLESEITTGVQMGTKTFSKYIYGMTKNEVAILKLDSIIDDLARHSGG